MKFIHRDSKTVPTNQPRLAKAEPPALIDAVQIIAGGPYPEGVEEDSDSSTGLSLTQACAPGDYVVTDEDGSKRIARKSTFEARHVMVPASGAQYTQEEAAHLRDQRAEEETLKAKG